MHRKKESCYVTMDIVVHARELKKKSISSIKFCLEFCFLWVSLLNFNVLDDFENHHINY